MVVVGGVLFRSGEVENGRKRSAGCVRVVGSRKEVVESVRASGKREARAAVVAIMMAVLAHCFRRQKGGGKSTVNKQSGYTLCWHCFSSISSVSPS